MLEGLKEALVDENVVAVVLDIEEAAPGLGQLEELHEAIKKFEAVDKSVYVHADMLSTRTYALATARVACQHDAHPACSGWAVSTAKAPTSGVCSISLGIQPDFEQREDYKTAVETYMREGPSRSGPPK